MAIVGSFDNYSAVPDNHPLFFSVSPSGHLLVHPEYSVCVDSAALTFLAKELLLS
jgi:hypothetical protein